jgi:NAD(P)-dependent dehydrogenase (short-subunit alcohol dehydrogenase family)
VLNGRRVLVIGVSRRGGIGFAVVEPLRSEGLDVRAVSDADLAEPDATSAPLGEWDVPHIAVRGLCSQAAAALAPKNVRVNCVNPGPTDTGYAAGQAWEQVRARFPAGRWGTPDDAARIIEFLLGEEATWITGQTIASEGGFRR